MLRTTLVVLAAMACAHARPQQLFALPVPNLFNTQQAIGQSKAAITTGETTDPFGNKSKVTNQAVGTSGQASGGGQNIGTATAGTQSASGPFGNINTANTDTTSVQKGQSPLNSFPLVHGINLSNPFASAQGSANAQLASGETVGTNGVTSIQQLGSSAGGKAEGGGSNISSSKASTTSIKTPQGSSTSSNLGSTSIQNRR